MCAVRLSGLALHTTLPGTYVPGYLYSAAPRLTRESFPRLAHDNAELSSIIRTMFAARPGQLRSGQARATLATLQEHVDGQLIQALVGQTLLQDLIFIELVAEQGRCALL